MLDFKVLVLVKKTMSPQWHSDDGPGSGTYSSEQQDLMLHPASIIYYAMHSIGYVLSSYTWCSPFIRELDDSCVLVMAQRIS